MRQFEMKYRKVMPETIGETDKDFDDYNYTIFLEQWVDKLLVISESACLKGNKPIECNQFTAIGNCEKCAYFNKRNRVI